MTRPPIDPATRAALDAFLARVPAHYGVARALLYGSRARGDHSAGSDADLALILDGPVRPFVATKLVLADIAYEVLLDTGLRISPLPIWREEWDHPDRYANPGLLRNIARDGISI